MEDPRINKIYVKHGVQAKTPVSVWDHFILLKI